MKKYCILLIIILCACNPTQKQPTEIIIDINEIKTIPFDSLKIKNLEYIPLETNADVLISTINKMLVLDNRIYVADYYVAKTLFVFDFQGKLILKIDKLGKGPGEYINFIDFNVTESGDIYLWDVAQQKLIKYSKDGKFVSEITISAQLINFMLFPNNRLYANQTFENGRFSNDLAYYDWNAGKFNQILPIIISEQLDLVQHTLQYFFHSPHACYFIQRFSKIAYKLDEYDAVPYIEFENMPLPPKSIIERWKKDSKEMFMDQKYIKNLSSIYESEDYITFVMYFMLPHQLIYQKKTNKCFRISDLYERLGSYTIAACNGNMYFSIIETDLMKALNTIQKNANDLQLSNSKQLRELEEESNPVIALFQFEIP